MFLCSVSIAHSLVWAADLRVGTDRSLGIELVCRGRLWITSVVLGSRVDLSSLAAARRRR